MPFPHGLARLLNPGARIHRVGNAVPKALRLLLQTVVDDAAILEQNPTAAPSGETFIVRHHYKRCAARFLNFK
jgi:hypothetical protein